jgi:kinesin family protein 15
MIQSSRKTGEHVTNISESRFHLVDLAGSERQRLTGSSGLRLKEAGNINKSLLSLGQVINALLDIANGKTRHVHYRDSKLTFLLRDSLGGNSKTFVIANISPSAHSFAETLSTLRFAQRVKMIRNKAVQNKDVFGNIEHLQEEIQRLHQEIRELKENGSQNVVTVAPGDNSSIYSYLSTTFEKQKELCNERTSLCAKVEKLELLVNQLYQEISVTPE